MFYSDSEIPHSIEERTDWGRAIGQYTTGIGSTVSVTNAGVYNATINYSLHDF